MAVNVVQNALSSRRVSRLLPWIAGAVLAAGVIAFLVAYFGNTADTSATKDTFGPGKAQTFNAQRQVKLEPAARIVAGKFISTAVARRNLAQAWPLATANVRGGLTYKEWLSGDIRVPALGVPIATAAITKIVYSSIRTRRTPSSTSSFSRSRTRTESRRRSTWST